jgi:hypothetical protein
MIVSYLQLCIVCVVIAFIICPSVDDTEVHPLNELAFGLAVLPLLPIVFIIYLIIKLIRL